MPQPADFGFGEEQAMLKDSARRFMEDKQPLLALRKVIAGTEDPYFGKERPGSYDREAWKEMVALGWSALAVPEAAGGVGMNLVSAVAVAEEVGRAAMPTPLTSTLQTIFVLREAATAAAENWLQQISEGKSGTLALYGKDGSHELDQSDVTAVDGRLNGTSFYVQDLQKVDFLVVAAREGDTVKLYALELSAEGVQLDFDRIVDLTRDQGRVTFNNVAAECIAEDGAATLQAALPATLTLVAADMAGASEWLLQATAEYAQIRTQFDRPIGFFQAVKHPVVNMMILADQTRSLVYAAACAYDTAPATAHRAAHLAKSSASDTAEFCANRATQLHGGIGFTWEHDVQIYHKRLIHSQHLYGDGVWQREQASKYL
ncbi:acyl-CoA dehydrogenase [Halieaceae bacterium IMCC14734]|uniref:Acyl-CoA dehydrogenase n=1 Tax=Candidatus Litorirhabdus singularis TaxID=2518993 RepID=A0ABT3TG17_9GAMM|nr:acyl-CoA/acyl-ACP dehydrogenase [Candidatus Litorirhabdus singularis]MCX2980765.1 acyl-CoA dehydrogenase [Candidatus Litorirhabdus singularis]